MNDELGIFGLTFPTGAVFREMKTTLPLLVENWTTKKIDDLYTLYKAGVKVEGIYNPPGKIQVKYWMMKNSNYPEVEIRAFLFTLFDMAREGRLDSKWWNIPLQKESTASKIVSKMESIPKTFEKISGNLKWLGIIAVLGIAVYFSWPVLKKIRQRGNK